MVVHDETSTGATSRVSEVRRVILERFDMSLGAALELLQA
jgi:aspartate aminotransferase-like enzyme